MYDTQFAMFVRERLFLTLLYAWVMAWVWFFLFVLIILYSLYLEYDSPLVPSASGLAG